MQPSFRDDIMANATQDTKFEEFILDNIKHEVRNRRNLLIAGRVLQYLRREGKTKAWLASEMGVTQQYVGKVLKGKGNMTMESIKKLEKATGLTLFTVPAEPSTPVTNRKTIWQGILSLTSEYVPVNQIIPTLTPTC